MQAFASEHLAALSERIMNSRWAKMLDKDQREQMIKLFLDFFKDFAIAWAVRGGVGFLPHMLKLLRLKKQPTLLLAIELTIF